MHGYVRNEEPLVYKIHQVLFECYLWLWFSLPSFGGIGYALPDVDDISAYSLYTDLTLI